MRITQHILFAVILLLSHYPVKCESKYRFMKIFSRDIQITTITRIPCKDLIATKSHDVFKSTIKDKNILNKITILLNECLFNEIYEGDAKIVCLLYTSRSVDTLSFYNSNYMIFNGKKAELNLRLLDLISSFVPYAQQERIEEHFRYLNRKLQRKIEYPTPNLPDK